MIDRFNVRVYFLLEDSEKGILVSDEIIKGNEYTKFPGGGLEFGEGTIECCEREAMEELGQEIRVLAHHHTTDFFVQSRFYASDQVLAIYYRAELKEAPSFRQATEAFAFESRIEGEESFRWVRWEELSESIFSFPTDRTAVSKLIKERSQDAS